MKTVLTNFFRRADILLLALSLIAALYGLLLIISAARSFAAARQMITIQATAIALGLILYIAITCIKPATYSKLWFLLAIFNVLFIALLFIWGQDNGSGNRNWLVFPFLPFNIQPAEVVKVTFILLLAAHFTALDKRLNHTLSVLSLGLHVGFMCGLILFASDDMGMAVVYVFIFLVMALCSGLHLLWILGAAGIGVAALPVLWHFVFQSHQKERILLILDPERDPLGFGWQTAQSQIALRNGGITGMGLFNGAQTQSQRLPFGHTDFIFSVAGEELGIIGTGVILLLLLAITWRCLSMSLRAHDMNERLICAGIGAMIMFQLFINVGMCLGIAPVIGLTLPFFSYGGSSVVTMFLAVGIISAVKRNAFQQL
ncbi:MAG: FtsW/RodA/SpoVE family cell cycle protein [Oscillospiraceae bacterium]|nr:FtsW/RodA/SpoVE family cell cycle protein [Oscillospiraceae bacterium]